MVTTDLATLRDLLARTKAATGPDPKLARDINVAFFTSVDEIHALMGNWTIPDFTASLDAVVALIGKLLPGAVWHVMTDYGDLNRAKIGPVGRPSASVYRDQDRPEFQVEDAETPALALCAALLAALAARMAREQRTTALSELAASDAELLP